MSASMNADPDLAVFREDLVALKRDVASLIEHMKGGATNTVQNAADQIERGVRSLRQEAGAEGERSAKAVSALRREAALCRADDRGRDRLRRRSRASAVSQASSASDLVKIALALLQAGAARAEPRPIGYFARIALLQLFALLCAVTALGCALVALWIYAAPMLGAAGITIDGCIFPKMWTARRELADEAIARNREIYTLPVMDMKAAERVLIERLAGAAGRAPSAGNPAHRACPKSENGRTSSSVRRPSGECQPK